MTAPMPQALIASKSELIHGDALTVLKSMPSQSVHCCVTSPPYWKLRDYNTEDQLGMEKDPFEYIEKLVLLFRALRNVLRHDGTLWLNMGDTYSSGGMGGGGGFMSSRGGRSWTEKMGKRGWRSAPEGFKNKDLIGIPWRLAIALQADGWYLRADIIWKKPNCSPSGITDRPTTSHEYVFLLSRRETYYYDKFAVTEPVTGNAHSRGRGVNPKAKIPSNWDTEPGKHERWRRHGPNSRFERDRVPAPRPKQNPSWSASVGHGLLTDRRNLRSVWTIAAQPFKGAHFATYPEKLVETPILAGSSEHGCCTLCGAPWRRLIETPEVARPQLEICGKYDSADPQDLQRRLATTRDQLRAATGQHDRYMPQPVMLGWEKGCGCTLSSEIAPCTILDPFVGSGTTAVVAQRFGRSFVGIDNNADYLRLAEERIRKAAAAREATA